MGFSDTLLRERESVWLTSGVNFPPGDGNRVKDVKEGSGVVNQDNAVILMIYKSACDGATESKAKVKKKDESGRYECGGTH